MFPVIDTSLGGRRGRLAALATPGLVYLAVRGAGVLLLWALSAANGVPFHLQHWDSGWYLQIAGRGYVDVEHFMQRTIGADHDYTAMAFFPGYPMLVGLLAWLLQGFYPASGIVVSTVAGVVGAYGITRLTRLCGGNRRAELAAVALVAGAPMAIVYSMPYPESLLVACVAWTLVALLRRRWLLTGAGTCAAGLVDPMAGPLILVVIVAGLVAAYRGHDDSWRPVLAAVLAPAGMGGYLLWVSVTSDIKGGFFTITRIGWGNEFDFGARTIEWIGTQLTDGGGAFKVLTVLLLVGSVVALVAVWGRLPWPLWIYTALTIVLIYVHAGVVTDRARLLLSAFPLLIALAVWLGRRRPADLAVVVLCFVAFGLWFSAYALTAQPDSI